MSGGALVENALAGALAVVLIGYLFVALVCPERF